MATPSDEPAAPVAPPPLPPAVELHLPGRGSVPVRHVPAPPGAPTVALIHGWTATADLNFFMVYPHLVDRVGLFAFDLRGHGSGVRGRGAFRLERCATDVVDVAAALGIDRFVPVGYSLGGAVAALIARDHAEQIDGLVLVATAPVFRTAPRERLESAGLGGLAALARVTPGPLTRRASQRYVERKTDGWQRWAVEQVERHHWRMVLEAGRAILEFNALDWMHELTTPTGCIVTLRDEVIPTKRQLLYVTGIPAVRADRLDGGHDVAVSRGPELGRLILEHVTAVTDASKRSAT